MYFDDRLDAGRRLADALRRYEGSHPLVLAIPRGAVPMGRIIADRLGGDLDVVLVAKLRSPVDPELAVGAIDEHGHVDVRDETLDLGIEKAYLQSEARTRLGMLRQRRALYTPGRGALDAKGRTVIVVDDGLATGATMAAALHSIRAEGPAKLVCAVPVASLHGLTQVQALADEVVALVRPPAFHAVSQFYHRFTQVENAEVVDLLRTTEKGIA